MRSCRCGRSGATGARQPSRPTPRCRSPRRAPRDRRRPPAPRAWPTPSPSGSRRFAPTRQNRPTPSPRPAPHPPARPGPSPRDSDTPDRLKALAGLIAQPLGIRVATVDADGEFDTHEGQAATLTRDLGAVGEALAMFQADLEARGIANRVLTFVWSEFGRRPTANKSAGTDH